MNNNNVNIDTNTKQRGLFIVFEGCNFVGKTTIINKYIEKFNKDNEKYKCYKFPNRTTETGKIIDKFLKKEHEFSNIKERLKLFSLNRHEQAKNIINDLKNGINVICDRYYISGMVYAFFDKFIKYKINLDLNNDKHILCLNMLIENDIGLPQPDITFLIDSTYRRIESERYHNTFYKNDILNSYINLLKITNQDYYLIYNKTNQLDEIVTIINQYVNHYINIMLKNQNNEIKYVTNDFNLNH